MLSDLSKAYEHIRYAALRARAATFGFPLRLLRLLLALYAMDRVLVFDGAAAQPFRPQNGVAAGCSFADLMMRLMVLAAMDAVQEAWPSVLGAAVVDDMQLQTMGPRGTATRTMKGAAKLLHRTLLDAKLVVNVGKLALLSNDREAAAEVAKGVQTHIRHAVHV